MHSTTWQRILLVCPTGSKGVTFRFMELNKVISKCTKNPIWLYSFFPHLVTVPRRRKSLFGAEERIQISSLQWWVTIKTQAWISSVTFSPGNSFANTAVTLDFFSNSSSSKWWFARERGYPSAGSEDLEEAMRRSGSPSQFCSIFDTSIGMVSKQLGWQSWVAAGSPASSLEVNGRTLCIFIDVSEWANSTLLLSNCFSALKKSALHFNRCHTKRYILQIQRYDQDI